ncbi:MFS-type transporter SLC18B1-like [Cylas formicarius]|uniref:MFS-type transporter SLC18B1-like n=1 Tax=Cylas formicarius TaxID=197179 RepID=UPI002958A6FF|nr:MFS-type transporter SLC18B1-like [Cylas formicarius]XP_060518538.1 MFS-type transporter SLC18B1-like [Cylas formicarius]
MALDVPVAFKDVTTLPSDAVTCDQTARVGETPPKCENKENTEISDVFCFRSKIGPVGGERKKTKFTFKQKLTLILLAAADFICFCSMSIMAPFYPVEVAQKGFSESMAGFVFGFYALVVFLSSPLFGKTLPKSGAKFLFIFGLFISGISNGLFGLLDRIANNQIFVVASFLIRGFEALGASAYATAGYVIIVDIFPDNAGAVRGLLETFVGLGLSAGPGIGGVLYAIGGFGMPFYVVGIVTIIIALTNMYLLPTPEKHEVEKCGSLLDLLKLPAVLVTSIVLIVNSITSSFLEPTLEPHLRKFNLSPSQIGLFFLILSATYGVCSPIWGWLTDRIDNYSWLMTTGLFCNSVVLLFLGPSPLFPFLEDSIALNIVTLAILGIFIAMTLMPTYQFLLDSSLENGFSDCIGTHSVIAGLWSSIYSLGEFIGPVLGGTLLENFNFPITSTTMSLLNFLAAIAGTVYFKCRARKCLNTPKKEEVHNATTFFMNVGELNSSHFDTRPISVDLEKRNVDLAQVGSKKTYF